MRRAMGGVIIGALAAVLNEWTLAVLAAPVDGSIDPDVLLIIRGFDVLVLVGAVATWHDWWRRVRWRHLGFALAPLVVLAVAAELGARLATVAPASAPSLLVEDAVLHHKWAPNLDEIVSARGVSYRLQTNSQSWLEPDEVARTKAPGATRVFYVGDSTTAGVVRREARVPDLAEAALGVEVINAGTSSFSTIAYYQLVRDVVLDYDPDLVVIQYDMTDVPNDLEYRPCTRFDAAGLPVTTIRPCTVAPLTPRGTLPLAWPDRVSAWLHARSAIYRLLFARWLKAQAAVRIRLGGASSEAVTLNRVADTARGADWMALAWTDEIERNVGWSMRLLGATIDLLRARGVAVLLTGAPHYLQFTGAWSSRPHQELAAVARAHGALYFDSFAALAPMVHGTPVEAYYWASDSTHFNEAGNRAWAEAEVRFLLGSHAYTSH